jgi:hypothetical protein
MCLCGAVFGAVSGGHRAAGLSFAGGIQWFALHRAHRQPVALHAQRSASMVGGLSTDAALDSRPMLRDHGRGLAYVAARIFRTQGTADGNDSGQLHLAIYA